MNLNVKIFHLKRKPMTVLACAVAVAVMFGAVNAPAVVASATQRQLPIYCVQRDQKMISISFDAAWGNEDTQQLIDILGKYDIKATFFVVGEWVDKYPESVKALHDAGHEVMNRPHVPAQPGGNHCRRERLQRQDRGGDRGAAHPDPAPLWGV